MLKQLEIKVARAPPSRDRVYGFSTSAEFSAKCSAIASRRAADAAGAARDGGCEPLEMIDAGTVRNGGCSINAGQRLLSAAAGTA